MDNTLDNLSGWDFEELCATVFRKDGYIDVKVTQKTNDVGKDIIMTYKDGHKSYPVLVECKHQEIVGRPVIQKLQGAMQHYNKNSTYIKGIVITSGFFSRTVKDYVDEINKDNYQKLEIELIDGKDLKELFKKHNISVQNRRVQIVCDKIIVHINENQNQKNIERELSNVIGYKKGLFKYSTKKVAYPSYLMNYSIHSNFSTTVGEIYNISKNNETIILNGITGEQYNDSISNLLLGNSLQLEELSSINCETFNFELSDNELEKEAKKDIVGLHSTNVNYSGRNNHVYTKACIPHERDITINSIYSFYLPKISNEINIVKQQYSQEFYAAGKGQEYLKDELDECKLCHNHGWFLDNNLYFCISCGKILCVWHRKLDAYDKTPVCLKCSHIKKLFLSKKYFISKDNKDKYIDKYDKMNIFQKWYEDQILFYGLIGLLIFIIILIISLI